MKLKKLLACIPLLALLLAPFGVSAEIPAMPEGGTALVSPGWKFDFDDPDVFSIKNDKIMASLMGYSVYGAFDLSYYDLKKADTFVLAGDLTINEKYDTYSGPRINFRGSEEGKAYQVAIQTDCVYVLDVDLRTGLYTCIYSNTTFLYELNTTYPIKILSSDTSFSLAINGRTLYENAKLPESRPPMFGLGNGVGIWNFANYTMYNAASAQAPVTVKPITDATNTTVATTTTTVAATTASTSSTEATRDKTTTSRVDTDTDVPNGGMPTWAIVLIVCGAVLLVGGGVAVVVIRRNKNKGTQ